MIKKVKAQGAMRYAGHSKKANGIVTLNLVARYGEMVNSIQTLQMLNNDVVVDADMPDGSSKHLGMFRIKNVKFDGDGESKISLVSDGYCVFPENIEGLPLSIDENNEFTVLFSCDVEDN